MKLKRPLCWLTRHHWLIQEIVPHHYVESLYAYAYQCQVCDKWLIQEILDLDADKRRKLLADDAVSDLEPSDHE